MKLQALLPTAILALARLTLTSPDNQSEVILPGQLGPYPVQIHEHEIKTSRPDPLAPSSELRRLMVTIYRPLLDNFTCPVEQQSHVQYIPSIVAEALEEPLSLNFSFDAVRLINCTIPISPSTPAAPLLLFSHGYGGTHHVYASLLLAAASSGYTVVAIDHTYEAAAVIFPDGYVAYPSPAEIAYNNNGTVGQTFLESIRIADAISVLDAIESGSVPEVGDLANEGSWVGSSNINETNSIQSTTNSSVRAVMFGHSFGGATSANVAFTDSRVLAAVNLDGPNFAPVANGTLRKPILMMSSSPDQTPAVDWPEFYTHHAKGWKTWVSPNNTVHYSSTDLPLVADLLNLRGGAIPLELTGTVDSRRLQEIWWRYLVHFFDWMLKGASPEFLEKPNSEFPDVAFYGHGQAVKA